MVEILGWLKYAHIAIRSVHRAHQMLCWARNLSDTSMFGQWEGTIAQYSSVWMVARILKFYSVFATDAVRNLDFL